MVTGRSGYAIVSADSGPRAELFADAFPHTALRKGFRVMPRYSLETIILVLILLWLLGAFVAPFGGGLIHLLLVVILVVVVIRLLQGRTVL